MKTTKSARGQRNQNQQEIVANLKLRIQEETPPRGSLAYPRNSVVAFGSLPISPETIQGLTVPKKKGGAAYTTLTEIQAQSIPHALCGRDILGAAQTGSGKTLAFCIPLLETLYRQCWNRNDGGIGAIVLSPTRELAGQTYAVLQQIGRFHNNLTMGLLIGGSNNNKRRANADQATSFQQEQWAIPTTNILICTPGRLLQHLEQTPYMDVSQLQILVLDEADRILDMGFRDALTRILDYLPQRQTLLFSATQTKTVQDLAVVSINRQNVEYIGIAPSKKKNSNDKKSKNGDIDDDNNINDNNDKDVAVETIPDRLKQSYVIVPLQHKLNCLWSFLKTHLRCKTMAFFSTCSQVRFAWDLFCRLRPGISVLAIHGKLSQQKRLEVYQKFSTTPHCVLFATDVASRGLDFPNVDWVLQIDAPEDLETYIHRVGRTARFRSKGQALLLLDPIEELVVKKWDICQKTHGKKPTLQKKSINPTKTMLVSQRAAALVAEHTTLQRLAKKSFGSYLRSLTLLPKSTWVDGVGNDDDEKDQSATTTSSNWNPLRLDWDAFSSSLGLAATPSIDILLQNTKSDRETLRETKNVNRKLAKLKEQIKAEKEKKKLEKKRKLRPYEDYSKEDRKQADNDEDDLLVIKARHESLLISETAPMTSRHAKKIRIDGGGGGGDIIPDNKHMVFDDDGKAEEKPKLLSSSQNVNNNDSSIGDEDLEQANKSYMERVRQRLDQTRELDKQEERERIRAKHKKKKAQERSMEENVNHEGGENKVMPTLGSSNDANDSDNEPSSADSENASSSSESESKNSSGKNGEDSSSSSSSDEDSDDDDDDSSDDAADIAAQEDLALSLIRGTA